MARYDDAVAFEILVKYCRRYGLTYALVSTGPRQVAVQLYAGDDPLPLVGGVNDDDELVTYPDLQAAVNAALAEANDLRA